MIAMSALPSFARLLARAACRAAMMLAFIMIAASGAVAESRYSFETTPGKLPKSVVPTHYAIELEPNLETLTLAGLQIIYLEVREPTARLALNALGMTL